jgi:glutamyl-tRNA reductase
MLLTVWGINHKTVPAAIRENYSISRDNAASGLSRLGEWTGIREAVILSTCNRTEIYAVLSSKEDMPVLHRFFLMLSGQNEAKKEYFYTKTGQDCIRHLFEVASGLDSMILGESQILNQIKKAYTMALSEGATRTILNTLFHRAVRTGKRVRAETGISTKAVSVSYAAVQMAEQKLGGLTGKRAVVFGAGEAAALTARHFTSHGVSQLIVANRHLDKARELAESFHGEAVVISDALEKAVDADVFITATGATQYILKLYDMIQFMERRREKPLVIVDIAVPADVDPRVGQIRNVTLYNMDSLNEKVEENKGFREEEADKARRIIEEEVASLEDRFHYLSTRPVMVSLSDRAEFIRKREMEKAFGKMPELSEEERRRINQMTRHIVRKILREPMMRLSRNAGTDKEPAERKAVAHVFHLAEDKGEKLEE